MKHIKDIPTILRYDGKLCEVVGVAHEKVLFIQEIGAKPCKKCGEVKEYAVVESSPKFQERAEAVVTLSVDENRVDLLKKLTRDMTNFGYEK